MGSVSAVPVSYPLSQKIPEFINLQPWDEPDYCETCSSLVDVTWTPTAPSTPVPHLAPALPGSWFAEPGQAVETPGKVVCEKLLQGLGCLFGPATEGRCCTHFSLVSRR